MAAASRTAAATRARACRSCSWAAATAASRAAGTWSTRMPRSCRTCSSRSWTSSTCRSIASVAARARCRWTSRRCRTSSTAFGGGAAGPPLLLFSPAVTDMKLQKHNRLFTLALALCALGAGPGDEALVEAAKKADRAAVQALLKAGADVNARAGDGSTALLWASYRDDLELVDMLLDRKSVV